MCHGAGDGRRWDRGREGGEWGRVVTLHGGCNVIVGLCPGAEQEFTHGSGTATCTGSLGHGWNGCMEATWEWSSCTQGRTFYSCYLKKKNDTNSLPSISSISLSFPSCLR